MSYPIWATPPDLGSYPEGTSLTENALILAFGDTALAPVSVQLLNGQLPPGISWSVQEYQIILTGFLRSVSSSQSYNFTFRLSNGVNIADRTFYMQVENVSLQNFTWITDDSQPLTHVYTPQESIVQVRARTEPITGINYTILNPLLLSQGLALDSDSGDITLNYAWMPLTVYEPVRDYVITVSGLFVCTIGGTSGSSISPQGSGYFVDSDYPQWQPQRFYTVNSVVHADLGKIYLCVSQGFSGVSGPTGTGATILDNTVLWSYQDQVPVWLRVTPNTIVDQNFTVVATSGAQSIARQFSVKLVSIPYEPLWLTPEGALPDAFTKLSYSVQLEAVDPDLNALTWSSGDLPSWLQLSSVGQLSGIAPTVLQNTTYNFSVQISDPISSSVRNFSVTVVENLVEFLWLTNSDLGIQKDGVMSSLQVSAQSTRSDVFITYGLSGGQLPPGLSLNTQSGAVEGFVEYHAQAKTYAWEVWATDGVDNIIQQFTVRVEPQLLGHYWSLAVPLWGPTAEQWQIQNSESVVSTDNLYLPQVSGWGRTLKPAVSIISGISGANAQNVRELIQPFMHNFTLQIHDLQLLAGATDDYQVLAVRVQDSDTVKLWKSNTFYRKGQRVSNTLGDRYIALNSGTSGTQSPQSEALEISDGGIVWSWDSVTNNQSSVSSPLPWYPYHKYQVGEVVIQKGILYQVQEPGTSAGSWGPEGDEPLIVDGSVLWKPIYSPSPHNFGNLFSPDNIRNMRSSLISALGWSTGEGTGFTADVQVNFNGGITNINITNAGRGYYKTPQVSILGAGSGAQVTIALGIVGVQIINGGLGWQLGDQFELNGGSGTPAVFEITSVGTGGTVLNVQVKDSGVFSQVPSDPLQFSNDVNSLLVIRLLSGIIRCEVVSGGQGYVAGQTQIVASGKEYSHSLQSFVDTPQLMIPLAYVNSSWANSVNVNNLFNPFQSDLIDVRAITASIQGIQYQGSNTFDSDVCTWDSDATRLVDATPATALEWDNNLTVWDQGLTVWDNASLVWPQYTQTVFDDNQTIWDYYRTILDQSVPTMQSAYSRTWVWWMGQPWRGAK